MTDAPRQQGEYEEYVEEAAPGSRSARTIWTLRAAGVVGAAVVWLALGGSAGLPPDARWVAAVATLMAIWWMTEAIPLAATSLLPIVLIPALTERTVAEATSPYASSIVFLFLGGFLIAIAMEKWNLHRRVALLTLSRVGVEPKRIVLGLMLATGFLSMWVSNTATTLMMLPIGLSVLALVTERTAGEHGAVRVEGAHHRPGHVDPIHDENLRRFGVCLVLAIAWSATMGGLGTLLGSPPNAIVAGYAADELGREIGFLDWMMLGTPLAFTFILIGWVLMTRVLYPFKLAEIPGGRQMIDDEIHKLGSVSQGEKMVMIVFGSAAFLWVVPGLLSSIPGIGDNLGWFGELDDTAIAIAAGIAMFIMPGPRPYRDGAELEGRRGRPALGRAAAVRRRPQPRRRGRRDRPRRLVRRAGHGARRAADRAPGRVDHRDRAVPDRDHLEHRDRRDLHSRPRRRRDRHRRRRR